MQPLAIYTPDQLNSNDPPKLDQLTWRFLAEGDSWFTIGTLNPAKNSNLLFELAFDGWAGAVNCASPGDTLRRMSQMGLDPWFTNLLKGRQARAWDGILMSCGGNDLIDAVGVIGDGIPRSQRLLLRSDEWGPASDGPMRYFSQDGWNAFAGYLQANLDHIIRLRDSGPSQGAPLFLHGYAYPTPRPSSAGPKLGPWLMPALVAYGIPKADWIGVAKLLLQQLGLTFAAAAADTARYPSLHFFDSTTIAVTPSELDTEGESGDWVNEIHLTWRGYEKVAEPWSRFIEQTLKAAR